MLLTIFFCYALIICFLRGNPLLNTYILGQIDRFLLPIITVILMGWVLSYETTNPEFIWKKILISVVSGCIIVSLIVFYQAFVEPQNWLNYFLPGNVTFKDIGTTAENAFQMGRFTGIFSSPFESGLYMSVGLFLSIYLVLSNYNKKFGFLGIILISLGGLMSLSKVMFLGTILGFFIACLGFK